MALLTGVNAINLRETGAPALPPYQIIPPPESAWPRKFVPSPVSPTISAI